MIGAANRPESRIVPTLIGAVRWRGLGVPARRGLRFGCGPTRPAWRTLDRRRFGRLVVRIGVGDVFGQAPPEKSGNWPSSGAMENGAISPPESAGPGSPGAGLGAEFARVSFRSTGGAAGASPDGLFGRCGRGNRPWPVSRARDSDVSDASSAASSVAWPATTVSGWPEAVGADADFCGEPYWTWKVTGPIENSSLGRRRTSPATFSPRTNVPFRDPRSRRMTTPSRQRRAQCLRLISEWAIFKSAWRLRPRIVGSLTLNRRLSVLPPTTTNVACMALFAGSGRKNGVSRRPGHHPVSRTGDPS